MRLLHTADWHLGASLDSVSLLPDQERFLRWLLEVIEKERIDALLVSGDIFDLRHPSADAQALYYRFLAQLAALDRAPAAILTAGNHDSPSRMDAPSELLDALRIRVVGAVGPREDWIDRLLVPLPDAEDPSVVVAAVPYVHEHGLGVSPVGLTVRELANEMRDAFRELYTHLSGEAAGRWPGAARIAMGHLTASAEPVARADFPNEIHQVGTIDALPPDIFGEGWDYIALGHIHRPMPAGRSDARYSGTPVPVSFGEGMPGRELRLVEVTPEGELHHRALPVPRWRKLVSLSGTEQEVLDALSGAFDESRPNGDELHRDELEPLLRVEVEVPRYDPALELRLRDRVERLGAGAPRLLAVVQRSAHDADASPGDLEAPTLEELQPDQVFARLVAARRGDAPPESDDPLMVAFRDLLADAEDS